MTDDEPPQPPPTAQPELDGDGVDDGINNYVSIEIKSFHANYLVWSSVDDMPYSYAIINKDVRFVDDWLSRNQCSLRATAGDIRDHTEYRVHWAYMLEMELRGHIGSALQLKFKEELDNIENFRENFMPLIEESGSIMVVGEG